MAQSRERPYAGRRGKALRWALVAAGSVLALAACAVFYLVTYDFNQMKPELIRQVYQATGRRLVLHGDLKLDLGLDLGLTMGRAALLNPGWAQRQELVSVDSLSARVEMLPLLAGHLRIRSLDVSGLDLMIEIAADGRSNLDPAAMERASSKKDRKAAPGKEVETTAAGAQPTIALLQAQGARVRLLDRRTGHDLSLSFDHLVLRNPAAGPARLSLRGRLNQWPLAMAASVSRGGSGGTSWRLSDLELSLGGSDVSGELLLAPGQKRPLVSGRLTSRVLDLRTLGSPGGKAGVRPESSGKEKVKAGSGGSERGPGRSRRRVFPQTPLDWGWLQVLDLRLGCRIGRLLWSGPELNGVSLSVQMAQGRLALKPLNAELAGGRLRGSLDISTRKAGGVSLSVDAGLAGANLNRLLPKGARAMETGGEITALLGAKTKGISPANLLAAAKGVAVLQVRGGVMEPGLMDFFGGGILAKLIARLNPFTEKRQRTRLECLLLRADLGKGKARASVLFMETDAVAASGSGRLDLASEKLDLALDPRPKKGIGVAGLAEVDVSLSGLLRPFKLGGTLAAPRVALDPAGLLETVGSTIAWYGLLGPGGLIGGLVEGSLGAQAGCPQAEKAAWKSLQRP